MRAQKASLLGMRPREQALSRFNSGLPPLLNQFIILQIMVSNMSIFNIKKQQKKLMEQAANIEAIEDILPAQTAYNAYLVATYSKFGKVLSFIPLTNAYNCRVACANAIKQAVEKLNDIRDYRASLANQQAVAVCLQGSKSAEQPELTKCYGSPINWKELAATLPRPSPEIMRKQLRDPWQTGTRTR
jgi:hypothetical protein